MTKKRKKTVGLVRRTRDGSIDGRDLRRGSRTGRTFLLGVRVTQEFPAYVKQLASKHGCTIGALIEGAVYQVHPRPTKKRPSDPNLG